MICCILAIAAALLGIGLIGGGIAVLTNETQEEGTSEVIE